MGTISVTLPADGDTADAADYNTPINTIVNAVNGNIDADNIEAGGVVPNALMSGTGTSWAWPTWTPTYANITIGNGTVVARYIQQGKTVRGKWSLVLGSTSAISGSPTVSLPVAASSNFSADDNIGFGRQNDANGGDFPCFAKYDGTNFEIQSPSGVAGVFENISSTLPFTWASGDKLQFSFFYEAA